MTTQLHHVRLHGLGLTDDFLLQLSDRAQTGKVEGATPASYDLPPKTSLEEAIQDAWDDARKAWAKYQQHGTDAWAGWVRPLLRALDYNFVGGGAAGGKYAVGHLTETGDVPLHFTRQPDLDRVTDETGLRVSPHGLMQGYLNAMPEHLWGLVTNGETLRLLRDNPQVTRPAYAEFQIGEMLRTEDARASGCCGCCSTAPGCAAARRGRWKPGTRRARCSASAPTTPCATGYSSPSNTSGPAFCGTTRSCWSARAAAKSGPRTFTARP
ncbi:hypothetical protein ACXXDK_17705 (plasmid) [Deinococcus sp. PESE-38]